MREFYSINQQPVSPYKGEGSKNLKIVSTYIMDTQRPFALFFQSLELCCKDNFRGRFGGHIFIFISSAHCSWGGDLYLRLFNSAGCVNGDERGRRRGERHSIWLDEMSCSAAVRKMFAYVTAHPSGKCAEMNFEFRSWISSHTAKVRLNRQQYGLPEK